MVSYGKPVEQSALPLCAQGVLPLSAQQMSHASLDHRDFRCGTVLVKASQDAEQDACRVEAPYAAERRLFVLMGSLTSKGFDRHRFCYRASCRASCRGQLGDIVHL